MVISYNLNHRSLFVVNGVISRIPVVIGVIAVIPASFLKDDWCYKLVENGDFLPKMGLKNQNYNYPLYDKTRFLKSDIK